MGITPKEAVKDLEEPKKDGTTTSPVVIKAAPKRHVKKPHLKRKQPSKKVKSNG